MPEPTPSVALGAATTAAAYALVLVLALLLALWGAFLVPLRIGGVPLPLSCVVAVAGNALLGWAGGRLLGRLGAAGPGVVWMTVVVLLALQRPEGDLVIPGSAVGLLFLVAGALTSAVTYGATPRPRRA